MTRMPSSRATMAAGTSPPRVMQTMAENGPDSLSRQASARESRWNWSHDTGNIFAGETGSSIAISGTATNREDRAAGQGLAHIEHEIEAPRAALARPLHLHHQLAAEQTVAAVPGFVGEVELGGEQAAARWLHLHVIVPGAALVRRRHDGEEPVAPLRVRVLVPAQAKAGIVVVAGIVRVPEIDQRAPYRPAAPGQHQTDEFHRLALDAGLAQVGALGRSRLEEGP